MKKHLLPLTALLTTLVVVAQTLTTPTPVDHRYDFGWDDPNPTGTITTWTVYASNVVNGTVRSAASRSLGVDILTPLNGAAAGTYALFVIGTTDLGDTTDASTNLYVRWPGGSGKAKGAVNLRVGR